MNKPEQVKLVRGEAPPDGYLPRLPAELASRARVAEELRVRIRRAESEEEE